MRLVLGNKVTTIFVFLYFLKSKRKIKLQVYNEYIVMDHPSRKIADNLLDGDVNTISKKISYSKLIAHTDWKFIVAVAYKHDAPTLVSNEMLINFLISCSEANYIASTTRYSKLITVDDMPANKLAYYNAYNKKSNKKCKIVRMSGGVGRKEPKFGCDDIYVWTYSQVQESIEKKEATRVFQFVKKIDNPKLKNDYNNIVIGIATNSKNSKINLVNVIRHLQNALPCAKIIYRPHPNKDTSHWVNSSIDISRPEESLYNFFDKIDFLVSGLSSIMPIAVESGVPVVYEKTLDPIYADGRMSEDHIYYKWIKLGYIYESSGNYSIDLKNIRTFYASNKWHDLSCSQNQKHPNSISVRKI